MTAFRDAARTVLEARLPVGVHGWGPWIEGTLDELDGCVPPQGIDRDALIDPVELMGVIIGYAPNRRIDLQVAFRDRILALVQHADGITLTREEAERVSGALRWIDEYAPINLRINSHAKEIAARLEEASS